MLQRSGGWTMPEALDTCAASSVAAPWLEHGRGRRVVAASYIT